jgi:hypothetical protein
MQIWQNGHGGLYQLLEQIRLSNRPQMAHGVTVLMDSDSVQACISDNYFVVSEAQTSFSKQCLGNTNIYAPFELIKMILPFTSKTIQQGIKILAYTLC